MKMNEGGEISSQIVEGKGYEHQANLQTTSNWCWNSLFGSIRVITMFTVFGHIVKQLNVKF
jgi:hypothetical protein